MTDVLPTGFLWLGVEELMREGFRRSRVVMVNEAHDGMRRCVRTRLVGQRLLPVAHDLGVRVLAMEALGPPGQEQQFLASGLGYLSQPDMRQLIESARQLGFELRGYEADPRAVPFAPSVPSLSVKWSNWRDEVQARNLVALLAERPSPERLLVWCGGIHHLKASIWRWSWSGLRRWRLMGSCFERLARIEHFAIDQTVTVAYRNRPRHLELVAAAEADLRARGGTAGFLTSRFQRGADAVVLSLDNNLE